MKNVFSRYFILIIPIFLIISCSSVEEEEIRQDLIYIQAVAYPLFETNTLIEKTDGYGPFIFAKMVFVPIDVKIITNYYIPGNSTPVTRSDVGIILPRTYVYVDIQSGIDVTNLTVETNLDYFPFYEPHARMVIDTENQFLSFCDLIKEHEIININGSNLMTYRIASEQEIMSILDNPDDGDYYLEPLQLNFQNPGITNGEIETKFICDPAGVTNLEVCATNTNMEAYAHDICVALQEHYYPLSGIVTLRLTNE